MSDQIFPAGFPQDRAQRAGAARRAFAAGLWRHRRGRAAGGGWRLVFLARQPGAGACGDGQRQGSGGGGGGSDLDASGYVVARRTATLSAKIQGKVTEVDFEEGQKVKAGDIVARLDDSNYLATLRQFQAQARQAKAAHGQ